MKTSFLGKGKFKLVLFATLCTVVLGCAIFLCFNIYSKNNGSADNAEATKTDISARWKTATPTADSNDTPDIVGTVIDDAKIKILSVHNNSNDSYVISEDGRTATVPYRPIWEDGCSIYFNSQLANCVDYVTDSMYETSIPAGHMILDGTENKSASVTFTPKSGYTFKSGANSVTLTLQYSVRDISSNAWVDDIPNQIYTSSPIEPTIRLALHKNSVCFQSGDYKVSYSNNVNVGTATVRIYGDSTTPYITGSITKTFKIVDGAHVINGAGYSVELEYTTGVYTGYNEPAVTLYRNGTPLTINKDYAVAYHSYKYIGSNSITITGIGEYAGTRTEYFTLTRLNLDDTAITLKTNSYVYDGRSKTPGVTGRYQGAVVYGFYCYDVTYSDNVNAGTATVTVQPNSYYATGNPRTLTFKIEKLNLADTELTLDTDTFVYDGSTKLPVPTVKIGGNTIPASDYSVSYSNNFKAGEATVTVTGNGGNCFGEISKKFTIKPRSITGATVAAIATQNYTGNAIEPLPRITDLGRTLTKDTDYTLSYEHNIEMGTATVIITGKGNFAGTLTANFKIVADIDKVTVTGIEPEYKWTGEAIKPEPSLTLGGVPLVKGTDYTVEYTDNTDLGTATVTIKGIGNYNSTKTITFKIVAVDINDATLSGIDSNYAYIGTAITPEPQLVLDGKTLVKDTDYTVAYSDNTALGTATVTVTGKGNYTGVKTVTFEITAADVENATVTGVDESYGYSGSAIEPAVTVTLGGSTLVADVDYTVTYTDNTALGTANVTVTGKGNYTGVKTVMFEITAADVENATITGVDESYGYTGSAIEPTVTVTLSGITLVKDTDYTVSYTNNTALGTATVTLTGKGNYTGVKTVTFEITAADIAKATLSGIDKNYPYTGSAITPEPQLVLNGKTLVKDTDFTVTYRNNINLGAAVVEINGIGNYTGTKSTAFTVIKANIGTARVDSVNPEYEHTGAAIEPPPVVTLNGVTLVKDRDYTVEYENNVEIGTATYKITGTGNYEGSITGSFKITIALPKVEVNFVSYNGTDKLFAGKALPEITATATYNGATVEGTLSWDLKDPILEEGTHDYYWTFTPADADNFAVVTGYKTLTAEKPNYIAIRAEWRSGSQPELFTSSTIAFLKQNLKITGIFSSGDVDEIVGGYALVGSWDSPEATNTVKMPVNGGDDFTVTVNFGAWSDTIVSVVIQDVILKEITVDSAEGKEIKTEYTALDGFDVSSVTVTAKYNDGSEKVLPSGNNGYSVVYEKGADSLQYGDTKVTLSFTDNGVTKTVEVNGLTISKKPLDKPLVFAPEDTDYNYGNPVTDGIGLKDLPDWINVTYVYEDEEGNILDPSAVKNAGKYKVTAKFTVDKNHADIADITATFEVKKLTPAINPSVGGSLSVGKSLSELTVVAGGEAPAGKLTWDNSAYQLQEGVNKCYYTFTPDDTVNFNVVHGFVEVTASGEIAPVVNGTGLVGWQIALIVVCLVVVAIALIALMVALKSRRAAADADGFYDDASPEDMK